MSCLARDSSASAARSFLIFFCFWSSYLFPKNKKNKQLGKFPLQNLLEYCAPWRSNRTGSSSGSFAAKASWATISDFVTEGTEGVARRGGGQTNAGSGVHTRPPPSSITSTRPSSALFPPAAAQRSAPRPTRRRVQERPVIGSAQRGGFRRSTCQGIGQSAPLVPCRAAARSRGLRLPLGPRTSSAAGAAPPPGLAGQAGPASQASGTKPARQAGWPGQPSKAGPARPGRHARLVLTVPT